MPDVLLRISTALLGVTFAWAAVAKLVRWERWNKALRGYELPGSVRALAAPAAPAAEAAGAILILGGRTHVGAALTIALLSAFSGALLYAHARRGDRLPCGCFGRATERDYRLMLARNAFLAALAAILLLARDDVWLLDDLSGPSGGDVLPALLVVAGLGLCIWLVSHVFSSFERKRSS